MTGVVSCLDSRAPANGEAPAPSEKKRPRPGAGLCPDTQRVLSGVVAAFLASDFPVPSASALSAESVAPVSALYDTARAELATLSPDAKLASVGKTPSQVAGTVRELVLGARPRIDERSDERIKQELAAASEAVREFLGAGSSSFAKAYKDDGLVGEAARKAVGDARKKRKQDKATSAKPGHHDDGDGDSSSRDGSAALEPPAPVAAGAPGAPGEAPTASVTVASVLAVWRDALHQTACLLAQPEAQGLTSAAVVANTAAVVAHTAALVANTAAVKEHGARALRAGEAMDESDGDDCTKEEADEEDEEEDDEEDEEEDEEDEEEDEEDEEDEEEEEDEETAQAEGAATFTDDESDDGDDDDSSDGDKAEQGGGAEAPAAAANE